VPCILLAVDWLQRSIVDHYRLKPRWAFRSRANEF
jgi:hypothetical protein